MVLMISTGTILGFMATPIKKTSAKKKAYFSQPKGITYHVTCQLCSNIFTDPRLLPCMHSFCFKCIKDETKSCPTCKKPFEVPEQGLQDLPRDLRKQYEVEVAEYAVKIEGSSEVACDRCIDSSSENKAAVFCGQCCKFLCSKCKEDHLRHREKYKHKLISTGAKQEDFTSLFGSISHKSTNCEIHNDEVLKFFCETCNKLVCRDCLILQHNGHKYDRVEQLAEKGKKELKCLVTEAEAASEKLQTSISKANEMIKQVARKKEAVDKVIHSEYQKLCKAVEARKNALLAENKELSLHKVSALQNQEKSMTNLKKSIADMNSKTKKALDLYFPVELLSAQSAITCGLKSLDTEFKSLSTDLCENDAVSTSFDAESLMTSIDKFGIITTDYSPTKCTVSLGSSILVKGVKRTVKVTVKDAKGILYQKGQIQLVAHMSQTTCEEIMTYTGKDQNNGTYLVDITAQTVGAHNLDVKIQNQSIQSSPLQVYVRPQRDYRYMRVSLTINLSDKPHDVAVSGNKLFIVSTANNIMVADKDTGLLLQPITCQSKSGGQVGDTSHGIAAQDDILYICDDSQGCVHKITTTGEYLTQIGSAGSGEGQLQAPRGLCVGHDGRLYVAEVTNNRISVFKTDGTFSHHITGSMNPPWGIAMDNLGRLHVTNHTSSTITVLDSNGICIRTYGCGDANQPTGISVTADNFSIVANSGCTTNRRQANPSYNSTHGYNSYTGNYDYANNNSSKVIVYDENSVLVHTSQDIYRGYGVTCDREGCIFICDYGNSRVIKY